MKDKTSLILITTGSILLGWNIITWIFNYESPLLLPITFTVVLITGIIGTLSFSGYLRPVIKQLKPGVEHE